ncbi:MAG: arsenate reductase ArsC [Candidatus Thalassarchaeaceae archaeon]|nr:arsenate reductase ArsC [Candidatus Thalassarchaeaceae archaeon]
MRLLFVCVGNTCRSQMAEALAKDLGHKAMSAGTNPGGNVAEKSLEVLGELGIDASAQYPKSIDSIDATGFDRIISMGCGVECPILPIDEDWGLDDPYGMGIEVYRKTRDRIIGRLAGLS